MSSTFRALRSSNYRLYFYGQLISMVGTWMQSTVQAWLVYRLTGSASWLGIIVFCSQVPAFFVSPLAGNYADRHDRRKMLVWVSVLELLQAFALAMLVFTDTVQIWHVAALSMLMGIFNAFDTVTRHAFAYDMVGQADLSSAIALNSTLINSSRIVGPALAGFLIKPLGEGWCFMMNSLSYLAVIYGLLRITTRQERMEWPIARNQWQQMLEAIRYIRGIPRMATFFGLASFISLVGFPYFVLLPVYAKVILSGDAQTLAWLTGAVGVGAVLGAIFAGASTEVHTTLPKLKIYMGMLGVFFGLFGFSHQLWLALLSTFGIGFFLMGSFPMINTTIQQLIDPRMRGRVLSLYTMTFFGTAPLGGLIAGWLADRFGAPTVAWISGGLFFAVAAWGLLVNPCRPCPKDDRVIA